MFPTCSVASKLKRHQPEGTGIARRTETVALLRGRPVGTTKAPGTLAIISVCFFVKMPRRRKHTALETNSFSKHLEKHPIWEEKIVGNTVEGMLYSGCSQEAVLTELRKTNTELQGIHQTHKAIHSQLNKTDYPGTV